jgi:hypothetical protein
MKKLLYPSVLLVCVSACCPLARTKPSSTPVPISVAETPTPYPTYTPYATYTPGAGEPYPTQEPEPTYEYPAPHLLSPPNGSKFGRHDTIVLEWDSPVELREGQFFVLEIWKEGESPDEGQSHDTDEKAWPIRCGYYPGRYRWRVFLKSRSTMGRGGGTTILSPPSATWSFSWLSTCPPCPCLTPTP